MSMFQWRVGHIPRLSMLQCHNYLLLECWQCILVFLFYLSYKDEMKECKKNVQGEVKKSCSKKCYVFLAIVILFIGVALYQSIFGESKYIRVLFEFPSSARHWNWVISANVKFDVNDVMGCTIYSKKVIWSITSGSWIIHPLHVNRSHSIIINR